jgi:hypothetical protein
MADWLALAIWLFIAVVAVGHWSTQGVVRGMLAGYLAAMINSALLASGIPLMSMAVLVGPVVEESLRTLGARKDRDFTLAQVMLFTAGFVLVELFVKLTRGPAGQILERAMTVGAPATRGFALHLLTTLILAIAINRSRDLLKSWPIWAALPLMILVHAVFNFLVFWRQTADFFGSRAGEVPPFAFVAFLISGLVCLAAMSPRRFGWKWG